MASKERSGVSTFRKQALNNSIAIGGCARSGTSILGTLLATAKEAEYIYDPAFVHQMLFRDSIDAADWSELIEVFLYDEFFLNHLAGRNLNFNKHDLTNIFNFKSESIRSRLNQKNSRSMLESAAVESRILFKVTDFAFAADRFEHSWPKMKQVYIFRNPDETISSLKKKQWFAPNPELERGSTPLISGHATGDQWVPSFALKHWGEEQWLAFSETEKYLNYYLLSNQKILAIGTDALFVDYQALCECTEEVTDRLFRELDLNKTGKTREVAGGIFPRSNKGGAPAEDGTTDEAWSLYEELKSRSI